MIHEPSVIEPIAEGSLLSRARYPLPAVWLEQGEKSPKKALLAYSYFFLYVYNAS